MRRETMCIAGTIIGLVALVIAACAYGMPAYSTRSQLAEKHKASTMLLAKKVLDIPPDPDPKSVEPPDRKAEISAEFLKKYREGVSPVEFVGGESLPEKPELGEERWCYQIAIDAYQKDGKIEYHMKTLGRLPGDDAPLSPYVIARAGLCGASIRCATGIDRPGISRRA